MLSVAALALRRRGGVVQTALGARWMSSVVSPEWLRESDLKSGAVRVMDCGHPTEYQRAHIPTATSFYGFKATNLKAQ
jgi:hypothetical protein